MFSKLTQADVQNIVIFRALQLGDLLCAIPAIRSLKKTFPQARITLLGLPWQKEFVQRFSLYFDNFMEFPGFPGLPEQPIDPLKIITFLQEMQKKSFTLALQMQGDGSYVNSLIMLFGAKKVGGFYLPGSYCPDPTFFSPYPEHVHEIRRHTALFSFLGIPNFSEELEYPLTQQEQQQTNVLQKQYRLKDKKYICIHPGARDSKRRWDPLYFAHLGNLLSAKGYTIVLTGTEEETYVTQLVQKHMDTPAINLAGKTTLGTIGGLIQNALLLIANDTGVSHIASAIKTPSIIIFSEYSQLIRWTPLDKTNHIPIPANERNNIDYIIQKTNNILQKEESFSLHIPKETMLTI